MKKQRQKNLPLGRSLRVIGGILFILGGKSYGIWGHTKEHLENVLKEDFNDNPHYLDKRNSNEKLKKIEVEFKTKIFDRQFFTDISPEVPSREGGAPPQQAKNLKDLTVYSGFLSNLVYASEDFKEAEKIEEFEGKIQKKAGADEVKVFCERSFGGTEEKGTDWKYITGMVLKKGDTFFVTVHGTDGILDWLTNGQFLKKDTGLKEEREAATHAGFTTRANLSCLSLWEKLAELGYTPQNPIVFTGHSMGGSVTEILASKVHSRLVHEVDKFFEKKYDRYLLKKRQMTCTDRDKEQVKANVLETLSNCFFVVTFAAPHPGNETFNRYMNKYLKNIYHVEQSIDCLNSSLVPQAGYLATGKVLTIPNNIIDQHKMMNYLTYLYELEAQDYKFVETKETYQEVGTKMGAYIESIASLFRCPQRVRSWRMSIKDYSYLERLYLWPWGIYGYLTGSQEEYIPTKYIKKHPNYRKYLKKKILDTSLPLDKKNEVNDGI